MSSAIRSSERQALRRVAREYQRDGYEVLIEPSTEMLPDWLGSFQIDLLASNKDEHVVVEIKSQPNLNAPPPVDALARAVESHAGWRLDFVVVNSRGAKLTHERERLLDEKELGRRIEMASKLQDEGLYEAAMLMLWSAIEGALRRSAVLAGILIESFDTIALLKQLHFQGLLTADQYRSLRGAADIRNATAHGLKSRAPSSDSLEALKDLANDLLRAG